MQSYINSRVPTFVVTLLVFTIAPSYGQQIQSLQIWPNSNCTAATQINTTASATYNISGYPTISFRANGLWSIEVCNSTVSCMTRRIVSGNSASTGCTPLPIPTPVNSTYLTVTRFGNDRQNESAITFFTDVDFQGLSRTVTPPGANFTFSARSYFFTGVNRWELKSNISTNGICVTNSASVGSVGYGITFQTSENVQIASVLHNTCGRSDSFRNNGNYAAVILALFSLVSIIY